MLIYLGVVLSVIKFRLSGTREKGVYRIPGGFLIPFAAVLAILWVQSNLPVNELIGMMNKSRYCIIE